MARAIHENSAIFPALFSLLILSLVHSRPERSDCVAAFTARGATGPGPGAYDVPRRPAAVSSDVKWFILTIA